MEENQTPDNSVAGRIAAKLEASEATKKPAESLATAKEEGNGVKVENKEEKKEEKQETPVVKLDVTIEAEQNKEFEPFAELFKEEEKPKDEKKEKEVVAKSEEKDYTEYINKAKEYDETMSIPLIKAVADLVKSGKTDLLEIANEIGFQNVDKLPAREVYENGLKAEGYSEEAVTEAMEEFDGLKLVAQDKLAKPYRTELKQKQEEKLKNLTVNIPQENKVEQERVALVTKTATENLDKQISALAGKKYDGLLNITEEMLPQIKKVAAQFATPITDEAGKVTGYDLEGGIEAAILKLHKKSIIKAALTTGTTEGFRKFYTERTRPSNNDQASTATPVTGDELKNAIKGARKELYGG